MSWDSTKLSRLRKLHVLATGIICTFNSSLGTSMPSGAFDAIANQFAVSDPVQLSLLNSLNMAGFVLGPLLFGPLSEYIGRRPVLIVSFLGYIVFMLACSASPTYTVLLLFRLLCGFNAAAPTTVIGGLYADILDNPSQRGTAIAVFLTVNTLGSLFGPIVSGFASRVSWRWPFWVAAMMAAPGIPLLLMLPETFAPVLRNRQIRQQIKRGDYSNEGFLTHLNPLDVRSIFLSPITLMVTEPIVLFSSLYLALAYAILYLMFQAYPIVFQDLYSLSSGIAGLMYLPIAIGAILALFCFCIFTEWHSRSVLAGKPWAQREIYRRLPAACVAAPCMVISLFWLGWTSQNSISPAVPASGGLFFGVGFGLLFMSMLNYITDIFRQSSASAHAAASFTRSIGAVVVPLAAGPMYARLGIHWAPSVLGFIALAMGIIPFVFIFYGETLARKSKIARDLYG
ncbi:major facilitator superfamily domain-containing protein [Dactylonectria macrodidyma]|uniref:Major facilitator superfamily domain-containing protein n=1 Tax=Dactylonectria macrodidyma TaxID=307937 RepID=A0A9P9F6C1_9HYPO|nr:major facilitator superfamily domain-containing protein [Dactylonectria macrodidyma]